MIRLLLVLASLVAAPVAGLFASSPTSPEAPGHSPDGLSYAPQEEFTLIIDASGMPGENGWFLVPVTTAREAYVSIDTKYKHVSSGDKPWGSTILLGIDSQAYPMGGSAANGAFQELVVNAEGERVECCAEYRGAIPLNQYSTTQSSGSGGGFSGMIGPDTPVWVGLAAAAWEPGSKMKITIRSTEPLVAGAAKTGKTVEAIDLVAAAHAAGDNVRLGDQMIAGSPGTFERSWTPRGSGVLLAQYTAQHAAAARLTIQAPGIEGLEGDMVRDGYGGVGVVGKGTFTIGIEDVSTPRFGQQITNPQEYGYLYATAFFADIDVPLVGAVEYHGEFEDEDW